MFPLFEKIKELCKKRGISLGRLEEDLGFSRNTIYSMKTKKPSSERLYQIADYFQVSTDYLLGRTENPAVSKLAEEDEDLTPQYRSIQRKAKSLSVKDQERLLQLMDIAFQDALNGGVDDNHDF